MVGIYQITSPTGKIYIGQSWNVEKRILYYKRLDCNQQPKIYRSLLKYGVDAHEFTILKAIPTITTQKELDFWECYCISMYRTLGVVMLNAKEGGSNGKISDETKAKMSLSKKGIKREFFAGELNPYFGKKHTDEIKKKMSVAGKGKRIGCANGRAKAIIQFDLNGNIINEYSNIIEAANLIGISRQGISDCLNLRNKTAKGFKWSYKLTA